MPVVRVNDSVPIFHMTSTNNEEAFVRILVSASSKPKHCLPGIIISLVTGVNER